jgi:hypothetical protein
MRAHRQTTTRLPLTAALSLGLAAAILAAPSARAADDDVPVDTKILRSILGGLGLKRPGEGEIQYQERAPLVIPPDKNLPPPQAAGAAIANNPAWPNDPDVARAKLSAQEDKGYGSTEMVEREQNPLRPGELVPGASRTTRAARARMGAPDNSKEMGYGYGEVLSSKELGYNSSLWNTMFGARDNSENAKFTGEPARSALTDPPPGYQTPSPDQPYGLGNQVSSPKAERSYETRGEMSPDR